MRNSLSSNYVIQYCLDRKVLNKAVYVDARKDHFRAIDYDNGEDIVVRDPEKTFLTFLESVILIMIPRLTTLQIESEKPLKAALVIDNVDESEETDIKKVLLLI